MNWEQKKISNTGMVVTGKTPPTAHKEYYGGDYLFVTPTDLDHNNYYVKKTNSTISDIGKEVMRKQFLPPNSVMFTCIGNTIGKIAINHQECLTNQQINSIIPNGNNNYKFLYYLLIHITPQIRLLGGGVATPIVNKTKFENIEIRVPPLPVQCKIAGILSAYDDLIENNLKRIKLLDEAVMIIHKEFTQELSRSGSTHFEYVKDCLAFYIGGGWGEEDYSEVFTEPAYVIRGTDIPDVRKGNMSDIPLRYHKASNLASRQLASGDIIFEISNGQIKNIGRTNLVTDILLRQFEFPVMCASFTKLIRCNDKINPEYFYLILTDSQRNGLLYQYKSNSANGINNFAFETFINEFKIQIPSDNELREYSKIVKPYLTLASLLGEQNSKLRAARDILLPKLMKGEIEV
ncbi:MAG: restriction endonuclease subunit S [Candidatus Cloacimonetes bacterium]|nr:restriction endonuclease subunit S [Candidatus Cloacimonadota bacterium]